MLSGCSNSEGNFPKTVTTESKKTETELRKEVVSSTSKHVSSKIFASEKIGVSFEYPAQYNLNENQDMGGKVVERAYLWIGEKKFEGDTPGIEIISYENKNNDSPLNWAKNNPESSFNSKYKNIAVGGKSAIQYSYSIFDGVGTVDAIIFKNSKGGIVRISANYTSKTPEIKSDFDKIVKNIEIK